METSAEKQEQIVSFVEIVGESTDKARQFLEATNWNLDEAIQLFYAQSDNHELPSASTSSNLSNAPVVERQSHEYSDHTDYVRPPLPVKREALYDHEFIRRRDQQSAEPNSSWAFWDKGNDRLETLYRPPLELMFKGSFEQAKVEAAGQGKWLIANIQSPKEFSSYMLNRDTWANEGVRETISAFFIFWQIYEDNEEGRKVSTYYHLSEIPSTLVIDSITGQKMKAWTGTIDPQELLQDLIPYMDKGPKEFSLRRRRRVTSNVNNNIAHEQIVTSNVNSNAHKQIVQGKDVLADFSSLAINDDTQQKAAVEAIKEDNEQKAVESIKEDNQEKAAVKREYPALPEEPQGDKGVNICRLCVRFPDGMRVQRRFLQTDPIQLLWSFCSSQVKEASDGRQFRLAHAVPGASSKTLEYDTNLSFGDSGLSNTLISMMWE